MSAQSSDELAGGFEFRIGLSANVLRPLEEGLGGVFDQMAGGRGSRHDGFTLHKKYFLKNFEDLFYRIIGRWFWLNGVGIKKGRPKISQPGESKFEVLLLPGIAGIVRVNGGRLGSNIGTQALEHIPQEKRTNDQATDATAATSHCE
jgi:hypothetical protein